MKLPKIREVFFPLVLATFAAGGIESIGGSFVVPARWVLTILLGGYVLMTSRALKLVNSLVLAMVVVYIFWCLCTYSWSLAPQLTLLKVGALFLVIATMMLAGHEWAERHSLAQIPRFMWLFLFVALFAGLSNPAGFSDSSPDRQLYHGATGNPNFMAVLAAAAIVPAFWYIYRFRRNKRLANFWRIAALALLVPLYLTNSRAGILIFLCIFAAYEIAKGLARNAFKIAVGILTVLLVAVALPEARDAFIKRNIYKESAAFDNLFYSRSQNWRESYDAAIKGGWLGAGYGVSIDAGEFQGGLTTVGYGREKGNTQLAIVEETGLIGLVFYFLLIFIMFRETISAFLKSTNTDAKVLLGLLIGAGAGLSAQSFFEAWWVAPGSVEFPLFWAIMGVALGLARRVRRETVAREALQELAIRERFRRLAV